MNNTQLKKPVIVTGMHRSGTTMLTKILKQFGVFMGNMVEPNSESILFLKINEHLLKKGRATWYNPSPFLSSIDDNLPYYIIYTKYMIKKYSLVKYSSENNEIDHNKAYRWGWKDPRNIITIKIWKELFPQLKIINIFRNPLDVANSLRTRELLFARKGAIWWHFRAAYNYYKFGLHIKRCPALLNIDNGIKLWEEYVDASIRIKNNVLNIKYEDLLCRPTKILEELSRFIEIEYDCHKINEAIDLIDTKRIHVFINDSDLVNTYNKIKNNRLVIKVGYDNILI